MQEFKLKMEGLNYNEVGLGLQYRAKMVLR